jgi:DNA-binding response OmpR family regulator
MCKVLLVCCNPASANGIASELSKCGFETDVALSETEGAKLLGELSPDAVVVNSNSATSEGSTLCQRIRDGFNLPVILLGNDPEERVYISASEHRADWDYYMRLPVNYEELAARLKVLLWRYGKAEKPGNGRAHM